MKKGFWIKYLHLRPDLQRIVRAFRDRVRTEISPRPHPRLQDAFVSSPGRTTSTRRSIVAIIRDEFGEGNDFGQKIPPVA